MKSNATLFYNLFLVAGDFLALLGAFSVAYILRVTLDTRPLIEHTPARTYFVAFATVLPLWIVVHGFLGLYNHTIYERRFRELGRIFVGSFIGILVLIGYDFVTRKGLFPARLIPVYGMAIGFAFLVLFRSFARVARRWLYTFGFGVSNVLIIGDTNASVELVEAVRNTKYTGLHVLAVVGTKVAGLKMFSNFSDAATQLHGQMHSIIQTELYNDQTKNDEVLQYAQEHHVSYRFVPGNSDVFVGNIAVELFANRPMIAVHQTALVGWGRIAKRLFDLVASFLLITILSPVFIIISVVSKLTSPKSSIFFRQTRLTRFNSEFDVFKFRTLKNKYNGLSPEEGFKLMNKPELAEKYRANGDFLAKDPRLTRFGRFLRKTSLDELPQLFNVLRGDLSLVGPRALVPRELDAYAKKHAILSVKSGMTGLAQVSGRRNISFDERRQLDMFYVQNWSFGMDLSILIKTIKAVFSGIGAK